MKRKLTAREALELIHDVAEHVGFDRTDIANNKSDKSMDFIYRISHAALTARVKGSCGRHHDDWHAEGVTALKHLHQLAPEPVAPVDAPSGEKE